MFIFYDQEPLIYDYNKELFDYIVNNTQPPYVLVSTEQHSKEKDKILKEYPFVDVNYFFHIFAASDWFRGQPYLCDFVQPKDRIIKHAYILFNRLTTNERIYRGIFVAQLLKQGLTNRGLISFSKICPDGGDFIDNFNSIANKFSIPTELQQDTEYYLSKSEELRIDFNDSIIPNQSMLLSPMKDLMDSFVFVVTETCFWQDKTHLTEKIFKPIVLKMPFILVGCANNLEYLRGYGFKTFSEFWDESYDQEVNPTARLLKIIDVIKKISNLSNNQLKDMLVGMEPILEHNYNLFMSREFINGEFLKLKKSLSDISQFYEFISPYCRTPESIRLGQAIPVR